MKLRKNYHQFEDKRSLCDSYQLFLADSRILPMLPPLIGKYFFERKKQPMAVKIGTKNQQALLTQARDSTSMFISTGPTLSVKVGNQHLTAAQIAANIVAVVPALIDHVPGNWKAVATMSVKTASSVALPIWSSVVAGLEGHATEVPVSQLSVAAPAPKAVVAAPPAKAAAAKATKAGKAAPTPAVDMDDADFAQMVAESGLMGDSDDDLDEDAAPVKAKPAKGKGKAAAVVVTPSAARPAAALAAAAGAETMLSPVLYLCRVCASVPVSVPVFSSCVSGCVQPGKRLRHAPTRWPWPRRQPKLPPSKDASKIHRYTYSHARCDCFETH